MCFLLTFCESDVCCLVIYFISFYAYGRRQSEILLNALYWKPTLVDWALIVSIATVTHTMVKGISYVNETVVNFNVGLVYRGNTWLHVN